MIREDVRRAAACWLIEEQTFFGIIDDPCNAGIQALTCHCAASNDVPSMRLDASELKPFNDLIL